MSRGIWSFAAVLTVVLIVGVGIAVSAAVNAYSQAEQRYDAENRVTTHIVISRAKPGAVITNGAPFAASALRVRR